MPLPLPAAVYVICLASKWDERGAVTVNHFKGNAPTEYASLVQRFDAITPADFDVEREASPSALAIIKGKAERFTHADINAPAQVACSLSHQAVWKRCVELNEAVIIVEDDVQPSHLSTRLAHVRSAPSDADVVIMQCNYATTSPANAVGYDKVRSFCGTGMYYLTPHGAQTLLRGVSPVAIHVDFHMSKCIDAYDASFYMVANADDQWADDSTLSHTGIRKIKTERQQYYIYILAALLALAVVAVVSVSVAWALRRGRNAYN